MDVGVEVGVEVAVEVVEACIVPLDEGRRQLHGGEVNYKRMRVR